MYKKIIDRVNSTFRALKYRNYRLFFIGQCISLIGTWIQQIAMSWLIYSLTKSPLLMGIIAFTGSLPSIIASPLAGVWIDRVDKHKALILIQSLFLIQALILGILALSGRIQIWHIIILCMFLGVTVAIDMPLRQSFAGQLVDNSDDLLNSISLNSSSFNLARFIGPAVAGILISMFNEGICFIINAASYIAVIVALLAMKQINQKSINTNKKINIINDLKEGINYSFESIQLRTLILYIAFTSFVGMSYTVLMPIFAKEILNGNAQTLGFLMSSAGIGALIGALYLASKKTVTGLAGWIYISSLCFGIGLTTLGIIKHELVSLLTMLLVGFGMVIVIAACNTLIQHFSDEDKRGRVLSMYTIAFMGTAPIGCLFSGAVASKIGTQNTFLIEGLAIIIASFIFRGNLKYLNISPAIEGTKEQEAPVAVN